MAQYHTICKLSVTEDEEINDSDPSRMDKYIDVPVAYQYAIEKFTMDVFSTLSNSDLEEVIIQKLRDFITEKAVTGKRKRGPEFKWVNKAMGCGELAKDLKCIFEKCLKDLAAKCGQYPVPVRMMRSIGVQVARPMVPTATQTTQCQEENVVEPSAAAPVQSEGKPSATPSPVCGAEPVSPRVSSDADDAEERSPAEGLKVYEQPSLIISRDEVSSDSDYRCLVPGCASRDENAPGNLWVAFFKTSWLEADPRIPSVDIKGYLCGNHLNMEKDAIVTAIDSGNEVTVEPINTVTTADQMDSFDSFQNGSDDEPTCKKQKFDQVEETCEEEITINESDWRTGGIYFATSEDEEEDDSAASDSSQPQSIITERAVTGELKRRTDFLESELIKWKDEAMKYKKLAKDLKCMFEKCFKDLAERCDQSPVPSIGVQVARPMKKRSSCSMGKRPFRKLSLSQSASFLPKPDCKIMPLNSASTSTATGNSLNFSGISSVNATPQIIQLTADKLQNDAAVDGKSSGEEVTVECVETKFRKLRIRSKRDSQKCESDWMGLNVDETPCEDPGETAIDDLKNRAEKSAVMNPFVLLQRLVMVPTSDRGNQATQTTQYQQEKIVEPSAAAPVQSEGKPSATPSPVCGAEPISPRVSSDADDAEERSPAEVLEANGVCNPKEKTPLAQKTTSVTSDRCNQATQTTQCQQEIIVEPSAAAATCGKDVKKKLLLRYSSYRPHVCDDCGRRYKWKNSLLRHLRTIHPKKQPFECPDCGMCFGNWFKLERHRLTISHGGKRLFKCPDCGKRFSRRDNLISHRTIHSGALPFECAICGNCFRLKSYVHLHILTHLRSGDKKR